MLNGKHIVLGVTGSIAAYKAAELVRLLRAQDADVRVVLTRGGARFVTPLTLQSLSGHPVARKLLSEEAEASFGHIELARWADVVLIAPASANALARLAQGSADDLLSAVCLATTAPLLVAPAMNHRMWKNVATQGNVALLGERGVRVIGPDDGEQACGEFGPGRMTEPVEIVRRLAEFLGGGALAEKRVLITAGPTHEALDPVRFIGNRSSGKMGFALARAARDAGADVTLIAGPVKLETPRGVQRIDVCSAQQMYDAVLQHAPGRDIFIAAAAVADFRPRTTARQKIKKGAAGLTLELVENPDIVAAVAALKRRPYVVGFAAETQDVEQHARAKLKKKGLDLIAANVVGGARGGFEDDENALTLSWDDGTLKLPLAGKDRIAQQMIDFIAQRMALRKNAHRGK